jgi:hypothetical protein
VGAWLLRAVMAAWGSSSSSAMKQHDPEQCQLGTGPAHLGYQPTSQSRRGLAWGRGACHGVVMRGAAHSAAHGMARGAWWAARCTRAAWRVARGRGTSGAEWRGATVRTQQRHVCRHGEQQQLGAANAGDLYFCFLFNLYGAGRVTHLENPFPEASHALRAPL